MFKDCQGIPYPVFAKGVVIESAFVVGAIPFGSVSLLKVHLEQGSQEPAAGQFYMLHAIRSDVLLGRPISIYHSETKADGSFKFNQKDYNLKQHVCICPYEKLKAAEECFGAKYRDFDFYYLKDLIYTIGLEKEETTKINISGLEYVLVSL